MVRIVSRLLIAATLVLAVSAGCFSRVAAGQSEAPGPSELRIKRILERHVRRHEFPGGVLALRDPAGATFAVTAGVANAYRDDAPVDVNTPWVVGSVTKIFVAVVVLQLAQEGKLDLDASVEPFFPDLPAASTITTRQLLQHTSGLNEYLDSRVVLGDARREWSPWELIAAAVARGAVGAPGAGYHYANTNYLLLGEIIGQITSRPWYEEVRSRIVEPLALRNTGYVGEPSAPGIGAGHVTEHGRFVEATDRWHPSLGGAAGGIYSTTADLMVFTLALFEGDLLDPTRTTEMRTFIDCADLGYIGHAYGLGLERYTLRNLTLLGHMGVGSAHSAFIGYDPASRAAVAVQINAEQAGPAALMGAEAIAQVVGKDISPPPMPSISIGNTVYSHRTLKSVGSGERIGDVRVIGQQVNLSYPVVANEGRTRLDLSAGYQRLQFDYRGFTHPLESVHAMSITAFLRQRLTDTWGLILVASPGYADDLEGTASLDAVTSTFVAAGSYRFSDAFEIGFGAAIQNVFGEPLPLPVAAVDWTISDRLWLNAILPVNTELTWLPLDALGLRASLQISGSNFHGAERIYRVSNPQLNYSAVAADLGARWFMLPFVHVTVHGGYTLFRRFEFSDGRNTVPSADYELSNGPVFGIDLGIGR